jgi:glycosyltransferase involved in cell wall biosynthesis
MSNIDSKTDSATLLYQTYSNNKKITPKVSIGLPVYNGAKYLRQAIESVLSQTFTDFELIISDNNSTDATEAICKEYLEKDSRIRYIRQPLNIGAINNFNAVLKLARGTYYSWICHDDYLDAAYLETLVRYLDGHPDVVLCVSDFYIVKDDVIFDTRVQDLMRENAEWTTARSWFFTYSYRLIKTFYGLYRLNILHQNNICLQPGLNGIIYGAESSVLPKVALQGRIVGLPLFLRYERRFHPSITTTEKIPLKRLSLLINFIYTTFKYQVREVLLSKLSNMEKLKIYRKMLSCDIPLLFFYTWDCIPRGLYHWLSYIGFLHPLVNRYRLWIAKER